MFSLTLTAFILHMMLERIQSMCGRGSQNNLQTISCLRSRRLSRDVCRKETFRLRSCLSGRKLKPPGGRIKRLSEFTVQFVIQMCWFFSHHVQKSIFIKRKQSRHHSPPTRTQFAAMVEPHRPKRGYFYFLACSLSTKILLPETD